MIQEVFEGLYAKLALSFSPPVDQAGKPGVFILVQPAITLDPDPDQASDDLSILVDQIPRAGPIYQPSGLRASDVYSTILDQEPSQYVPQADREAALKARKAIFDSRRPGKYTAAYQAYLDLEAQKQAADDALASAKANFAATHQPIPAGLQEQVDKLEAAIRAPRADFAKKMALMEEADSDHMGARLQRAHEALELASSGGTPPVEASPDPGGWTGGAGWIKWTYSGKEPVLPRPASAPSGPVVPLGTPGPSPKLDSLTIAMEACRVRLNRPWMDGGLFANRYWRSGPDARWPMISTGDPGSKDPGPMPLRIDGLLLARNLRVTGIASESAASLAKAGRLPFAPKAPPSGSSPLSISMDGIQIIGFFCSRIPRCPDPDPKAFRSPEDSQ